MADYKIYKDLDLVQLDFPVINYILKLCFLIIYCFTLLLFPLVVYIIISFSIHRMSKYRLVILIQIIFSFSLSTVFFLWQPKFFFPAWLSTPTGFIDFGPATHFIFFPCALFCLVGALHVSLNAMIFSSIYRISQTYPNTFLHNLMNDKIWILTFTISTFSCLEIIFVGPTLLEDPDNSSVKLKIIEDMPIMSLIYHRYPSLSGYHPALSEGWIPFLLHCGCIVSILLPIWFAGTHLFFIRRMIHLQKHETFATWRLHRMLYRTLLVQALLLLSLVLIPLMLFVTAIYFGFQRASIIGASLPALFSLQAIGELFAIIYFIRPYRIFILQSLKRFLPQRNISRVFRLNPMPPIVAA